MATVSLTTTPTQLDDGTAASVFVLSNAPVLVNVFRGGVLVAALRPGGQSTMVYPEGAVVTAAVVSGSGSVSTTVTAKPVPGGGSVTVGTTAGTVAAGDDSRIVGALQASVATTTFAPLAAPALTGGATLDGSPIATTATAAGSAAGLAIVFGGI